MSMAETIQSKLEAAFAPDALDVVDDSARHAGHAGAQPGGETHFNVTMVAQAFDGVSRVERQRMVYGALAAELAGQVHALSLVLRAPAEPAVR